MNAITSKINLSEKHIHNLFRPNMWILMLSIATLTLPNIAFAQEEKPLLMVECERPKDPDYVNARATIARDWNIKYKLEPSCDLDPSFSAYVVRNNAKTSAKLTELKGENWRQEFDAQIQQEYDNQKAVRALIMKNDKVAALNADTTKKNLQIVLRKKPDNTYAALVMAQDEWEGIEQMIVFYKILADPTKESVTIKSDQKQPLLKKRSEEK